MRCVFIIKHVIVLHMTFAMICGNMGRWRGLLCVAFVYCIGADDPLRPKFHIIPEMKHWMNGAFTCAADSRSLHVLLKIQTGWCTIVDFTMCFFSIIHMELFGGTCHGTHVLLCHLCAYPDTLLISTSWYALSAWIHV
jgi:hypothetical protein